MGITYRLSARGFWIIVGLAMLLTGSGCVRVRQMAGFPPPPPAAQPVIYPAPLPPGSGPDPNAISPVEWKRLSVICARLQHTQKLSVQGMDYAAHLLHTPPPVKSSWEQNQRQLFTLAELTSLRPKILTPTERLHLFDVVVPYTSSPFPTVRANAMLVLGSSRDSRAIAALEKCSKTDPNKMNRSIASDIAKRLQAALSRHKTPSRSRGQKSSIAS